MTYKKTLAFKKFPEFIVGKSTENADRFITHTRYPRFLARIIGDEYMIFDTSYEWIGVVTRDENNQIIYKTPVGGGLCDFITLDVVSFDAKFFEDLTKSCNEALANFVQISAQKPEE